MSIYICAGDSITYGLWAGSSRWAELLRQFLEEKSLDGSVDVLNTKNYVAVYNLGIPGDTSRGLLARFDIEVAPRLNSEQETVVFIAIGTNDARFRDDTGDFEVSISETRSNVQQLIRKAKKISQKIVVFGLPPVDEKRVDPLYWDQGNHYRNRDIRDREEVIRDVAEEENVGFVEIFDAMKDLDIASLMEDGIHPNTKGHEVIFDLVKNFLVDKKYV